MRRDCLLFELTRALLHHARRAVVAFVSSHLMIVDGVISDICSDGQTPTESLLGPFVPDV